MSKLKPHELHRAMGDVRPVQLPGKPRRPKHTPRPRAQVDAPCRGCGAVRNAGPTCEHCGESYH